MSNKPQRDTQFLGFARRVIKDLDEVYALRMDIVSDELEELIARRAYDLVAHACEAVNDEEQKYESRITLDAMIDIVPDLPALPSEQSE
jgi:hypothetical protein